LFKFNVATQVSNNDIQMSHVNAEVPNGVSYISDAAVQVFNADA
jgi:hypothetical protein